jgi:hypothetical protein
MRFPVVVLAGAAVLALSFAPARAQVTLCAAAGFAAASGVTACDGGSARLTVTANVKTYARLSLEEVFGSPAASLQLAMGDVDAHCVSPAAAGLTCLGDATGTSATWYGDVKFRVKLSGVGATRARITGLRPPGGTIPSGRLLDGAAGAAPTAPYPIAPATPADLRTAIGSGDTVVARSLGLKVNATDPPGPWSGDTVFSLVLE